MYAGVGSGSRFRKGAGFQKFRRMLVYVLEGSGGFQKFRRVLVYVPEASSGRFGRVPVSSGVCWCSRVRKVLESSGVACCLAILTGAAM